MSIPLIIIAYFVNMLIPVATVVAFFWLQANRRVAIPVADSYHLPDDGVQKALPAAE